VSTTSIELELPDLHSTEEAITFGRQMTREQFIFVSGARSGLLMAFHKVVDQQEKMFIALDLQLFREACEAAPLEARS
jgi:hypothetical protein